MASGGKSERKYWWAADSDEFAEEYFSRISQPGASGYLQRLQMLAYRHFYGAMPPGYAGDMPNSAEVTRSGDQGSNIDLRVNWLRAHANAKHQIIVAPKLAWGCQAGNTDARSMADSSRGATILEALWKQTPIEMQSISAMLGAIICGEEFIFTYWQKTAGKQLAFNEATKRVEYEGDLVTYPVATWDTFRDPTAKAWEQSPWKSVRIPVLRWDLLAQFPEFEEEILKADSAPPTSVVDAKGSVTTVTNEDKVMCHYAFHERTPARPLGVQAVLLNPQCVMEFQQLDRCYEHVPIHRFSAGDLKGTPYSYTDFWEAMASQDLASDIQGSLATNIVTFGKQMVAAEQNSNLAPDQLGNGPKVIYYPKGGKPPEALQLTSSPPEAFKHLDNLKTDQRLQLGLTDVGMGEAPTGTPNAQAWALLATATVTANSGAQRAWVAGVRSVARSYLAIFKDKVSAPRKTMVVGVHGAAVPKQEEWVGSDFAGLDDVTIEIANPLSQTAAGRIQIHDMLKAAGFIQTPEQLQQVLETGQLNPLTQVLRDELIYIAWENEEILAGRNPPVKISDSHQMHIREHRGPTFSAEGRNDAAVNEAGDEHVRQHLEMWMKTDPRILAVFGQAAPPAPLPPPGAPPQEDPSKPGAPLAPPAPGVAPGLEANGVKPPAMPNNPLTGTPAGPPGVPT
jgi:hypothetical protein